MWNVVLNKVLSNKMMGNPNFNSDDSAVNIILKELSSCFEATYAELLANLVRQSSFKKLRRLGEQQFFNATESTHTMEEESQRIKLKFAEINLLAVSADNIIDTVISEKLQSNFLSKLKEEVLEIILKLYSDQDSSVQEKSKSAQLLQTVANPKGKKGKNVKIVLEKLSDVNKYLAQNLNDISRQVIDMSFENSACASENTEMLSLKIKEENTKDTDEDGIELGNLSFDSVSSVHTSDLSSFNDEISISSDEEIGMKRKKLSLKVVEEEVKQIRAKRKKVVKKEKKQVKSNKLKSLESEVLPNDSSSTQQQKSLPQRIRKPNSKYNTSDIISPFRMMSTEKVVQNKNSTAVQESKISNSLSRKRGRPRKNV